MSRRPFLFLAVLGALVALAAVVQKPAAGQFLVLEWAAKSQLPTPPAAVLIELGLKDTEPTDWSGTATARQAKVVHREGYRFRQKDKLTEPDGWTASSRRPIRVPQGQPAVARLEGLASTGVVLHLAEVQAEAALDLKLGKETVQVPLAPVLAGKATPILDGKGVVRRITTATPVAVGKTEDDFPAACYGPDGTLWVAYISYHLKDESRRIEQARLREQPANFREFFKPEFGDQLFIKGYREGKWSEPLAVTGPNEDLCRCAVNANPDGPVTVNYCGRRNGRLQLIVRLLHPSRPGSPLDEEKVVPGTAGNVLNPAGAVPANGLETVAIQNPAANGEWDPALVAGPTGQVAHAFDKSEAGDYDVFVRFHQGQGGEGPLPPAQVLAGSSRFEARPSICYDPKGRLWIAYEEGPEKWGKDYGAFDSQDGNPLYGAHSVRVVCLEGDKLMRPVAELPASPVKPPGFPLEANANLKFERQPRYSYPKIGIDGKGRVWLTYRQKFGTRYSTHAGSYWLTFARRLDGDHWTDPIEVHHSCGLLDHRPVLLPHKDGGLLLVHNTDGRYTEPETVHNHVYLSHIDLPGEPQEPKLVAHDPGKKDPKLVAAAQHEAENVKAIRGYRIEAGGKKYQLLRGEFHRHTEISWDGGPDGSLEDMFRYSLDAAALDWIGCGDHDNGAGREYSWWLTQKLTDAYHVPGHFTPLFSYERSNPYPHGHRNCIFAQRGVRTLPRLAEPDQTKRVAGIHADDTKMLYRYLKELGGLCASHTSATGMGTDWRDNDPEVEPIVEIYQGDRMSYEYQGAPRAGYDPKGNQLPHQIGGWQPLGFLDLALKKGYRLGFQSSSDHWSTHISFCVALAEKHDRESILAALKQRHCYGATDNVILDVRSGDHLMGDSFATDAAPTLAIHVIGTGGLAAVEVLKDSQVVATLKGQGREFRGNWTDPAPTAGVHYYYVRVQQASGDLAWSSPLWIDYRK